MALPTTSADPVASFVAALRRARDAGGDEAAMMRGARDAASAFPGARVEFSVEESYRNMGEILALHPEVVEYACDAVREAGLEVRSRPIRGGTDGSKLSFMGLPTPNIFAGEHNFHSRLEWVSVEDMEKAVEVIVNLARIWATKRAEPLSSRR